MKFAIKPIRHYPPHLRNVGALHWKYLKIQNFCRCSAHIEENATNCILSAPILIHLLVQLCILSAFMCFLSKSCSRR